LQLRSGMPSGWSYPVARRGPGWNDRGNDRPARRVWLSRQLRFAKCEDDAVLVSYGPTWMDQDSSWWAKANRAKEHIDSLRRQVDDYRASAPYSLTPEPTEKLARLAYRLRFPKPVPATVSTTVGDALHNLRAALESLAFEVARRSQGGTLTAKQEKDSTFPICESPEDFDAFFKGKNGLLYDRRGRAALRSVQPFVNLEEAHRLGIALDRNFEETFRWSELHRLDALWNIDKHRRLTLMAWRPDFVYWGSNGPSNRRATGRWHARGRLHPPLHRGDRRRPKRQTQSRIQPRAH
jgi:hypothetical protein